MPSAAAFDPLPLQNAVVKWAAQSAFGTAATPSTSAGAGLASYRKIANVSRVRGPGSANVVAVKQGSTYHEWAVRYEAAQSGIKNLLLKGKRTSGVLPYVTLGIGYEDDVTPTSNKSMQQIRDCLVNQLELGFDASGGVANLTASLSGMGTAAATLTNQARATLTSTPWTSAEAVFTADASAYRCPNFQLSVNQNVSLDYCIPGAAPASFIFGPTILTAHDEVITGTITRYQKIGYNVHADTPPEADLLIVLTNVDDAETLTITLNDVSFGEESEQHTAEGIRWSAPFEARTWDIA